MKKFEKYDIRVIIENTEFNFNTERRFDTEEEVKKYIETSMPEAKCEARFMKNDEDGRKIHCYFMVTGLNKFLVTIIDQRIGF